MYTSYTTYILLSCTPYLTDWISLSLALRVFVCVLFSLTSPLMLMALVVRA